ncbi:MAG: TlpA family protein disulfide reductase [Candidatus Dormibacteria bacterium]
MLLVTALVVVLAGAAVLYSALTPARSASGAAGAGRAGAPVSFTAATMSGQQVTVPGGKPSVLLFFGVTCGGCGPTATALGRLQRQAPGSANFVGVDITPGETDSDVRGFLTTNYATDLGYAFDTNTRLIKALGVTQLTTVIVLDTSGTPTYRAVEPTPAQVQTELTKLAAR